MDCGRRIHVHVLKSQLFFVEMCLSTSILHHGKVATKPSMSSYVTRPFRRRFVVCLLTQMLIPLLNNSHAERTWHGCRFRKTLSFVPRQGHPSLSSNHCEHESWIWLGLQDVHLITAWDALRFDTPLKWGVTVRMLNEPNSLDRCHENISWPSQSHTDSYRFRMALSYLQGFWLSSRLSLLSDCVCMLHSC